MRKIIFILLIIGLLAGGTVAQEEGKANIRVAHLSSDTGEVDVYLTAGDSILLQETFEFAGVSDWIEVEPDSYSLSILPFEGELEDALIDTEVDLEAGDWVTIAAIGEINKETVALQTLIEDYSPLDSIQSRLSVFHAVPNYQPVNVIVNDVELIRYLGYPGFWGPDSDGFITFDILARTNDIRLEQEDGTVAAELEDIIFGGNRHYFLAIAGVPSNPVFVFIGADLESVETEDG